MPQKNSLGRGLGAILPDILKDIEQRSPFLMAGIEELIPNRFQPRQDFNPEEQKKLVFSIRKNGIIQPIVVRQHQRGYEIIAGERRWRAAQAAGLHQVPIIIREAQDIDVAELSLIENIQRESLNPVEEGQAYQTLLEIFGLSQEDIAERVGKDRSTIANTIRLLRLPDQVKAALVEKKITSGHARAILALDTVARQLEVFRTVLKRSLTVRETELLVSKQQKPPENKDKKDVYLQDIESEMEKFLLTPVTINKGKNSGSIEIKFRGNEELSRLISLILGGQI